MHILHCSCLPAGSNAGAPPPGGRGLDLAARGRGKTPDDGPDGRGPHAPRPERLSRRPGLASPGDPEPKKAKRRPTPGTARRPRTERECPVDAIESTAHTPGRNHHRAADRDLATKAPESRTDGPTDWAEERKSRIPTNGAGGRRERTAVADTRAETRGGQRVNRPPAERGGLGPTETRRAARGTGYPGRMRRAGCKPGQKRRPR